jgi:N-acetylneuraminic acid mutarotase
MRASVLQVVGTLLLLLACSIDVSGIGAWIDDGKTFPAGKTTGTALSNGTVVLGADPSMAANWTRLSDGAPPYLSGHAMALDPIAGAVVLFGGFENIQELTWIFNTSKGVWKSATQDGPSPRYMASMVYDSLHGVVVMFGGSPDWPGNINLRETWTYNVSSDRWINKTMPEGPSARHFHTMAYDEKRGEAVMFGGVNSNGYLNDTWTYNLSLNVWTNRTPADSPPARIGHAMVYDSGTGASVLFGGARQQGYMQVPINDTWAYDSANNTWTNRTPPISPQPSMGHPMAYGDNNKKTVLYSESGGIRSGETWTYDAGTNTWTNVTKPTSLKGRYKGKMVYDPSSRSFLLIGGDNWQEPQGDMYSYDSESNSWTKIDPYPARRGQTTMAYDSWNGVLVLFGGGSFSVPRSDTWIYNLSTRAWKRMEPAVSPPARIGHAMAFDSAHGVMVMFGGYSSSWGDMGDTWTYNTRTNTWTNMNPPVTPPERQSNSMVYDSRNGVMVLFGGWHYYPEPSFYFNDTWTYNLTANTWTEKHPASAPCARHRHSMAYDDASGLTVLYGGYATYPGLDDTWTYDAKTNVWTNKTPVVAPGPFSAHSMVYHASMGKVLLFGGVGDRYLCDTWSYSVASNNWTNLHPSVFPSARFWHTMAYDSGNDAVILFGGIDQFTCNEQLDDVWAYGLKSLNHVGNFTSPPFNTGGHAFYSRIEWNSSSTPNTSVRFQLRSANSSGALSLASFIGPDGTSKSYYNTSGERINGIHNGSQWLQYRASLATSSSNETPALSSVRIPYNLMHNATILSPHGGENWTGVRDIAFNVSDLDNDSLACDIYLLDNGSSILLASNITGEKGAWQLDTRTVPNGTYGLRLVARDSNPEIPLTAEALSGNFTISHPRPNGPPTVELLSPPNGSTINRTSVQFSWNGSDPDRNPVNYFFILANTPFDLISPPSAIARTNMSTYTAEDLANGATYYWTVIPGDGLLNGSDGGLWHFKIDIGSTNRPPRFTSGMLANATLGQPLDYTVTAVDDDGDALDYSLVTAPGGMSINSTTGKMAWVPVAGQEGNISAGVRASDGKGGVADLNLTITVKVPVVWKPYCSITEPASGAKISGTTEIKGTATGISRAIASVQIRIDGRAWADAGGTTNWSFRLDTSTLENGMHTLEARAYDGQNLSDIASVEMIVDNQKDGTGSTSQGLLLPIIIIMVIVGAGLAGGLLMIRSKKGQAPPQAPAAAPPAQPDNMSGPPK